MRGFWTPEIDAQLKALADEGLSASQIAARLGRSRSSVIGRVFRLNGKVVLRGQSFRDRPKQQASSVKASRSPRRASPYSSPPSAPRSVTARRAKPPVAPPAGAAPSPAAPALPSALSLVLRPMPFLAAVEKNRCLWFACDPFAPGGPDMPVCGHERADMPNVRYCPRHLAGQVQERAA